MFQPGPRHWFIFGHLTRRVPAVDNLTQDAWYAAMVIESGREGMTVDGAYSSSEVSAGDGRTDSDWRLHSALANRDAGQSGQPRSRKPSVIALTSGRPTRAMALMRALTSARARNGLRANIWA